MEAKAFANMMVPNMGIEDRGVKRKLVKIWGRKEHSKGFTEGLVVRIDRF